MSDFEKPKLFFKKLGKIILHIVNNKIREDNDDLLDIGILEARDLKKLRTTLAFWVDLTRDNLETLNASAADKPH